MNPTAKPADGRRLPAPTAARRPAPLPLEVLSISSESEDHIAVRKYVTGMDCRLQTAESCDVAFARLNSARISIVVCERDLPDGNWLDVLEQIDSSLERPFLIVTSRIADERLWAEVLNRGGYDVLAKPLNERETRHVLETACLKRRDRELRPQRAMEK